MRLKHLIISCIVSASFFCAMASGQESSSDIQLRSSLQNAQIRQGSFMLVTASLIKNNEVLNSREITRHLKMSAYIKQPDNSGFLKALFDNGLDGDARPGDGIYTCRLTAAQPGDYIVKVIAEGKGLNRQQEHPFTVLRAEQTEKPQPTAAQSNKTENRNESETEKTGTGKDPWITFLVINAAAAVLWIAGFLFLYLRIKKAGPVLMQQRSIKFGEFIQGQAEEKMKQLLPDGGKKRDGATSDSRVINEMHAARAQFLKSVFEGSKKAGEDMSELWKHIYGSFDATLKTVLKDKKTAIDEIDVLQEKVEEIGSISDELKGAQALADAQAKKIAFLLSFKDVIAESQHKFDSLKKKNKDLEKKLFESAQKTGSGDAMKAPLAEFKENYKQLELCVETLEQENERLVDEVSRWQKELDHMKKQGAATVSETPVEVLKENEDLRGMVRELETTVKAKEKEIEDIRRTFESLESEYMVLYQEKQAAQQQPDI